MATQKTWLFLQNPILNATDNSYRLADRITTYHMGALQKMAGDPFFDVLIASYTPLHNSYTTSFNAWKSQSGLQKGQTLNVTQLLNLLRGTKIRQWDIAIQPVFAPGTPDYVKLLPNNRTPFQIGSQTDRIAAVDALSNGIGSIAALATVKADVDAFYTLISNALLAQKGDISGTKTNSDAVEAARVAMCIGQYANLGALIQKYAATPDSINQYFDLNAIRNGRQILFTGDTKPQENENILEHTFSTKDILLLNNEGNTSLSFYLGGKNAVAPGSTQVTVPAQTSQLVAVSLLGSLSDTFLYVYNPDTLTKGEWTVELQ